jgi:hypothetical protein
LYFKFEMRYYVLEYISIVLCIRVYILSVSFDMTTNNPIIYLLYFVFSVSFDMTNNNPIVGNHVM